MKMILAGMLTVVVSLTIAESASAAEQMPAEMIVAMASTKSVCGGNTGKACPGTAPATIPPPVAASPVIPAPKPSAPVTPTPPASTTTPGPAPTPPSVTTTVPPSSSTTTSIPTGHPMVTATLLGQTGEDVVGTMSGTPDGVKDVHIRLSGVSGTIKAVRITGLDGIWVTPANGTNWVVAIKPQSDPSVVDVYFDYFKVINAYIVTVTFSDGATQALQAATNNPSSIYLPVAASTPTVATSPAPAPTPTPTVTATTPSQSTNSNGNILGQAQASTLQFIGAPIQGGDGFAHAMWVSSINRMVVFVGPRHCASNVRAYDPVSNSWTFLYTEDCASPHGSSGHQGIPGRDNYASLYVPARDEMWLWGGSYVDGLPASEQYYSGRFSFAKCHPAVYENCGEWVYIALPGGDMGPGIIKNNLHWYGADPACAWSASANAGMCGWSFNGAGDSDGFGKWPYIVEPNNSSSVCAGAGTGNEPYIGCILPYPPVPSRQQCMQCMIAAGDELYLYGGETHLSDFWKYNLKTHQWTRLPDSPARPPWSGQVISYDSDLNAIVAWLDNKIYVYDIASNQWSDRTPANMPCIGNHVGVYAPNVKLHVYEGGTWCDGPSVERGTYSTFVVSLGTAGTTIPTSNPTPAPTAPPQPASTISATNNGISNVNKVGQQNSGPANSSNDIRVTLSGLRGIPNKVRVTSNNGGTWEHQYNGKNWDIDVSGLSSTGGDIYFEPLLNATTFHVKVTYSDNTSDEADATNAVTNPAPTSSTTATATPTATPAPTAIPTQISTPSSTGETCVNGLCLTPRMWKPVPLAPSDSPCSVGRGCKQWQAEFRPINNRIYYFGGDSNEFGTGGTFSVDIATNNWIVESPVCPNAPQITPSYPSEEAFVYDSKRDLFYYPSGFGYTGPASLHACANDPDDSRHIPPAVTFNPNTRLWSVSTFPGQYQSGIPGLGTTSQEALYDQQTDTFLAPVTFSGGMGMSILHLSGPQANTWEIVSLPCSTNSRGPQGACPSGTTYINAGFSVVENHFMAIDPIRRHFYFIKQSDGNGPAKLLRYHIDNRNVTILTDLPQDGCCWTGLVWDSINQVLYWWTDGENPDSRLYIYHPDPTGGANGWWEKDNFVSANGMLPQGNSIAFDPYHNALVVIGGVWWHKDPSDPYYEPNPSFMSHYFLYRYGDGK